MFTNPTLGIIGQVIIDSLWQGTLIAVFLAVILKWGIRHNVVLRYAACISALVILFALPVFSIVQVVPALQVHVAERDPVTAVEQVPAQQDVPGAGVAETDILMEPASKNALAVGSRGFTQLRYYLGMGWLVGVLVMLIRLGTGFVSVNRLQREQVYPVPADVQALFNRLLERMHIRQRVTVQQSARVSESILTGWIKPVVLLPVSVVTEMSTDHIEAIIAHELAHVKRYDHLVSGLQAIIETLLFYHPAVWWVSRQVRIEREHCCDDLAVRMMHDKKQYVEALYVLETKRPAFNRYALSVHDGSLLSRVRRLVQAGTARKSMSQSLLSILMVMCVLTTGLFVGSCTDRFGEEENPVAIGAGYEIPEELEAMIARDDAEAAIAYLHDRREAGDSEALEMALGAYAQASNNREFRQNLVFVFAHFNTLEADEVLIQIAELDRLAVVRENAMRAISLRIKHLPEEEDNRYAELMRDLKLDELYTYPAMSSEQEAALTPALKRIALDNEQSSGVRRSAISALQYRNDLPGFFETVVSSSQDPWVKMYAARHVRPRDKGADILIELHNTSDDDGFKRRVLFASASTGSLKVTPFLIHEALQSDDKESSWQALDALGILRNQMPRTSYTVFFASLEEAIDAQLDEMEPLTRRTFDDDGDKALAEYRAQHLASAVDFISRMFFREHSFQEQLVRAIAIKESLAFQDDTMIKEPLAVFEAKRTTGLYNASGQTASNGLLELFELAEIGDYITHELKGRVLHAWVRSGEAYRTYKHAVLINEGYYEIETRPLAPYQFGIMDMREMANDEITDQMKERAQTKHDAKVIMRKTEEGWEETAES